MTTTVTRTPRETRIRRSWLGRTTSAAAGVRFASGPLSNAAGAHSLSARGEGRAVLRGRAVRNARWRDANGRPWTGRPGRARRRPRGVQPWDRFSRSEPTARTFVEPLLAPVMPGVRASVPFSHRARAATAAPPRARLAREGDEGYEATKENGRARICVRRASPGCLTSGRQPLEPGQRLPAWR
jgi:hypothetical protein